MKDFLVNRAEWIDQSWGTGQPNPVPSTPPVQELGDVNNDGSVTVVDALMVAQYYVGIIPPNFDQSRADVNSDGFVNIVDALMISQYYVGIINAFPTT